MGKIGILTFHRASNYGAVLQAYALQTAIEKLGFSAEIIDYRCPEVEKAHNPYYSLKAHGITKLPKVLGDIIRYIRFQTFRGKYLHLSNQVYKNNININKSDFEKVVVGSDQVWNNFFSGKDEQYFMPFVPIEKKSTYAVSIGDKYDEQWLSLMLDKNLRDIDVISLREKEYVDVISTKINCECRVDVDPTFLLEKQDWLKIAQEPKRHKPYILVYTVAGPDKLIEKAKEVAKATGYDLLYINNKLFQNADIKKLSYISPEAFVGWFSEAEFIFTNSFHGTVFSIIMNRPFAVEDHSSRGINKRVLNLLELFDLTDRNIDNENYFRYREKINWQHVDELKSYKVSESISYLKQIL